MTERPFKLKLLDCFHKLYKNSRGSSFWALWLPLLVYAAGLLLISVLPVAGPKMGVAVSDKVGHAVAYWLFSYVALRAFASRWGYGGKSALAAVFLAVSYGALLELWQYFLPYRSYDPLDLLSDSVGVVSAQVSVFVLRKTLFAPDKMNTRKGRP